MNANNSYIIFSRELHELKRKAKQIKREKKIPHHQAIEIVAKDIGFDNWRQVKEAADACSPAEEAFQSGCVIAVDCKHYDGCALDPLSNFIEDDFLIAHNIYKDFIISINVDEDYPLEEFESELDMMMYDYVPLRYRSTEKAVNVEEVVQQAAKEFFWQRHYVWLHGTLFEVDNSVITDKTGSVVSTMF